MKYIALSFLLFSCTFKKKVYPVSQEKMDTIPALTTPVTAFPQVFETAFSKGDSQTIKGKTVKLYGINIGKIKVEGGHIIACDPMHLDEYGKPYTQLFPAGEFPVQLSIVNLGGEESIAFARILFSDEPVARWEFALLEGQKPLPINGEKTHEFCVDAGAGLYMDEMAAKAFDQSKSADTDADMFKEMGKHNHHAWRYTMYTFGTHNLAAFSTGLGDGCYSTYVGFDATGQPCRLLTDFNFFSWK